MAVLYGHDAFSVLVHSIKKWYSSFLKKGFVFHKICFKVKVLKTIKIFTDFNIKICYLSNGGLFWKSLIPFFRRAYPANIPLHGDVLKTSLVFVFRRRLDQSEYICLSHTSSEDFLIKTKIFVLAIRLAKTSSRNLQGVFKTFWRRLQDVWQRCLQDVFKTYHQVKQFP